MTAFPGKKRPQQTPEHEHGKCLPAKNSTLIENKLAPPSHDNMYSQSKCAHYCHVLSFTHPTNKNCFQLPQLVMACKKPIEGGAPPGSRASKATSAMREVCAWRFKKRSDSTPGSKGRLKASGSSARAEIWPWVKNRVTPNGLPWQMKPRTSNPWWLNFRSYPYIVCIEGIGLRGRRKPATQ